jgi:hypothetical protein
MTPSVTTMAKVVSRGRQTFANRQGSKRFHHQVCYPVAALDLTPHNDEGLASDNLALLLIQVRFYDSVHQSKLILKHHEDEPLGGPRLLPANNEASDIDSLAISDRLNHASGNHPFVQAWTQK